MYAIITLNNSVQPLGRPEILFRHKKEVRVSLMVNANEEYVDIVDEQDRVVGQVHRDEAHLLGHRPRIAHVLIFNQAGELGIQLRSQNKSYLPGYWTTSAGGHMTTGESYELSALRETEEELGVHLENMQFLAKDLFQHYRPGVGMLEEFLGTFTAIHDGPFTCNPDEVEKIEFFPLEKIQEMIKRGDKFHDELIFVLEKHYFGN